MIKLSQAEIDQLVAEREAELAREAERLKFEKSLQSLAKRMQKKGFFIGKKLWAHTERDEKNRWIVTTRRAD